MLKKLLFCSLFLTLCVVASPKAHAQCTYCISAGECGYDSYTGGGCGCRIFKTSKYVQCATCGLCFGSLCIYPCDPGNCPNPPYCNCDPTSGTCRNRVGVHGPTPAALRMNRTPSDALIARIRLQSDAMANVLSAEKATFPNGWCSDRPQGKFENKVTGEKGDWKALLVANGYQVTIHVNGKKQVLNVFDAGGWNLSIEGSPLIVEPASMADDALNERRLWLTRIRASYSGWDDIRNKI